jgi:hypothetical protein
MLELLEIVKDQCRVLNFKYTKIILFILITFSWTNLSLAEIFVLNKCYWHSVTDKKNSLQSYDFKDKSWSEKSYNEFLNMWNIEVNNFTIDTDRGIISNISGTQDNLEKINYLITDYYDGVFFHEDNGKPNDPTSPVSSIKRYKIQINLNLNTITHDVFGQHTVRTSATDPGQTTIINNYIAKSFCESNNKNSTSTNKPSKKNNSTLKSILKMLN